MSVSFNHIVGVLRVGCTGYFEVGAVWIDYVYLESRTAVVADAETHGPLLELCVDVQRGQTYKVSLTAQHERLGRFKFKATSMTLLDERSLDAARPCAGPSFAVVLSGDASPTAFPFEHGASVLMVQGVASAQYIGLKYMLKEVFSVASPKRKADLWAAIFSYCLEWGETFRLIELESLSNWTFIHAHDFPCQKIPRALGEADLAQVARVRATAALELDRRYASGGQDCDPKVDLPSGKCDVTEREGRVRLETPLEACVRELEEETGLSPASLLLLGRSDCSCAGMNVRSAFYFFRLRPDCGARVVAKDAYVASSWTQPKHVLAFMRAVEGSARRWGRFDSLRRAGLPEEVHAALVAVRAAPCEEDLRFWRGKVDVDALSAGLAAVGIDRRRSKPSKPAPDKFDQSFSRLRPAASSLVLGAELAAEVERADLWGALEVRGGDWRGRVRGFPHNRAQGRPFRAGDQLRVVVTGAEELCPTSEFVRPLVILDVNGVLGVREAFTAASKTRKFLVRDSAVQFVEFLQRHFEVALWSCSKRQNLDEDVQALFPNAGEDRFCFQWHQDDSTNLWPRHSEVSEHKPLFLKELSRVWSRFPCFSARNTVLVDNHAEKFERNPLGTCLCIPEFTGEEDGALRLDGELCAALRALADSGDTQKHMLERSGASPLFPARHPGSAEVVAAPSATAAESAADVNARAPRVVAVAAVKKKTDFVVVDEGEGAFDDSFVKSYANRAGNSKARGAGR